MEGVGRMFYGDADYTWLILASSLLYTLHSSRQF